MTHSRHAVFALLVLAALPLPASAQARFSINNPLIKPASRALPAAAADDPAAASPPASQRLPTARPVPDGGAPIPAPASAGGLPTQPADSAVREELSAYTVVAIVGGVAVLRTHVGLGAPAAATSPSGSTGGGSSYGSSGAGAPSAGGQTLRQQTMRVRTGQPLTVGGALVVPQVAVSTVEFRLASGRGGLLHTASLDSHSAQAFVPSTREAMDPAVAARSAPTPLSIGAGGAGATAGAGSATSGVASSNTGTGR